MSDDNAYAYHDLQDAAARSYRQNMLSFDAVTRWPTRRLLA